MMTAEHIADLRRNIAAGTAVTSDRSNYVCEEDWLSALAHVDREKAELEDALRDRDTAQLQALEREGK